MRRTRTAALGLTLALGTALAPAASASAAAPVERVPLAAGSQPEGVASEGTTYWAGARLDGAIYTGDLRTGSRRLLVPGRPDHAARGMQLDPATRTLWVAGDVRRADGSTRSTVNGYDADTGALRRSVTVPGQRFLNDVQVVGGAVYVTDSLSRQLVVVRPGGFRLLAMTGDWVQPAPGGLGANGIRLLPGGSLVVTDSSTGGLFRVDPATGVATRITLSGPALHSGDGLVVRGSTVYVVYGFGTDGVAEVRLAADGASGTVVGQLTDPDLHRPTTAVLAAGALYAVNGRFGVPPTPRTEYGIIRVALG